MTAFLWRALFAVVVVVLVAQNILLWHSSGKPSEPSIPLPKNGHRPASQPEESHPESQTTLVSHESNWTYEPLKHAEDFTLNRHKCEIAFPDLWYEIDRSVSYWKHNISRSITEDDISLDWRENGAFRALIHRNQLRIIETKGIFTLEDSQFPERAIAVWQQIHRALLGATAAGETLPSIEFSVSVDDRPDTPEEDPEDTHTLWSFSRKYDNPAHDRAWVMPDFNFWSWRGVAGSFTEMRARGKQLDEYIEDKIQKAVWRGVVWTNPDVRAPLLEATQGKPWADVVEFDWMTHANFIPMEDFCRYALLVHTEGRSWSGRLKYLLNCDSVTMIHDREWTAHYYSLLKDSGPGQNYVSVRRDFSDLREKVLHQLTDVRDAQRIANNAVATFRDRYLTLAAETCYWRRMIQSWSDIAFSPEVYEDVEKNITGKMKTKRMLRGIAFEEMVTQGARRDEYPPTPKEEEPAEGEGEGEGEVGGEGEGEGEGEAEGEGEGEEGGQGEGEGSEAETKEGAHGTNEGGSSSDGSDKEGGGADAPQTSSAAKHGQTG